MRHEHAARALGEVRQIGTASSGPAPVLPHAPPPLHGIAVGSTASRQAMQPTPRMPVGQRRRQRVGAVEAPPVDAHPPLWPARAKAGQDWRDILPKPVGIPLGDHLRADVRGAILDRAQDAEPHAVGHTAPPPRAAPCLALEGLRTSDWGGAEGPGRPTKALGWAVPPARPRQGQPPSESCLCVAHKHLATRGAGRPGGQGERPPCPCSRGGSEPSRGAPGAAIFF
jgi:hypothetical protein